MAPHRRWLSQADFARAFDVSEADISRSIKNGTLKVHTRKGRRVLDMKTAGPAFLAASKHLAARPPSPAVLAGAANGGTSELFDMAQNRVERERYRALKEKLEYERRMGDLVPYREVEQDWIRIATLIRKAVKAIPDRLAPIVAVEEDARRCWALLDEETSNILIDLADELGKEAG